MLDKLNMLSTEVLQNMTKSIGVILGARLDTRVQSYAVPPRSAAAKCMNEE